MSKSIKNQPLPGSASHLQDLETAWRVGSFPCPACTKETPIADLNPLQINECPYCKTTFFMPRKLGEYFLFEPSGGGGMGSVYKAVSKKFPGRVLAVKVLARKERNNPPNIRALLNEAEVSAHFNDSDYIAGCLDNGFIEDEFFTVMPFVSGERLDKRIDRLGKMPFREIVPMTLHILAAEQHIFSRGYLFRDMKPENIIINEFGYAVLLDFGLCITLDKARNPDDEIISGSPYYMPPERLLGKPEDAYSELYSIAMVVYHAFTGKTFYDADELEELAKMHVAKMRVSTAAKLAEFPQPMAAILEKMLRQAPEERPQSFREVFDEVQKML